MLENTMQISLSLIAIDKMSKVIRDSVRKSDESFDKMKRKIEDVSKKMANIGKTATMVGGALIGLNAVNLKVAADFETGMSSVSTLIDTTKESMSEMNKEVLNIAKRTPVALDGLTTSLYDIRSAGISAENQFKVLEKSAQLGVAGLGSTQEAVDLVTSSLNAFQLKGEEAERVYDTIFKTVKFGKTTITGIAQGFGAVAGTISAANIKLDDYLAAIAALTTTGQPAAQAHTQIKAAIAGMTRENKEAVAVFKSLGVNNFKELIQKSGGMVSAFRLVTQQVKGNDAAILKLFGSTEAYNAVVGLTTKQYQAYADALDAMRNQPSFVDEGYQKKLNTANAQMQRMRNFMQKISIDFGSAITLMFGKFLDFSQVGLDLLDKMPTKFKQFLAISVTGLGTLIAGFGVSCLFGSKLLAFYGGFLEKARALTPALMSNSVQLLKVMGLGSSSHSLDTAFNVFKAGNKLNLDLPRHVLLGFGADIRRIDNNLKTAFKALPSNILKSTIALKDWAIASVKAIPVNFMGGLNALKTGFLSIPSMIKTAIVSFRAFSLTLLTSPLGWIALAIAGVAFVIFKYWKPITGFFKGVWQGLKEGLAPLKPAFNQLVKALEPVVRPIKAVFDWFKKLFTPVEDVGGSAEKMGVKFGKALAGIILKLVDLVKKAFEFGAKIGDMLTFGLLSKTGKTKEAIGKHSQIIRDHLPHSPAKTGPLKDLHKVKIAETIASTIKPFPIMAAMNKSLGFVSGGLKSSVGRASGGGTSTIIHYNPTITISGSGGNVKDDFLAQLKKHKEEIVSIIRKENDRKMRLAY